jgi:purine-binding chemotaxis protein CheW
MQELKFIVFKVGGQSYGIDIGGVQGIENKMEIIKTPNSPDYIKGIINLRGEVIPIYNLRNKFGLENIDSTEDTKYIVVATNECKFALEVDCVENIENAPEDKIYNAPLMVKNEDTGYVDKIVNAQERLIIIINPSYLLDESERHKIKEMLKDS